MLNGGQFVDQNYNNNTNVWTHDIDTSANPLCDGGCVSDVDNDGVCDDVDNCKFKANPNQADTDGDGVGDVCDNCVHVANPNQADSDNDGIGDACETTGGCANQ